jgi:hypothetical protein
LLLKSLDGAQGGRCPALLWLSVFFAVQCLLLQFAAGADMRTAMMPGSVRIAVDVLAGSRALSIVLVLIRLRQGKLRLRVMPVHPARSL